jgi:hypothetical protein
MLTLKTIVILTDVLMPITVLSIWWTLRRARQGGPSAVLIALTLSTALAWGAAWVWHPTLAASRFLPAPAGQAGAIIGLIIALNLLRLAPGVRAMFRLIDVHRLVDLGVWRVIYGAALLALGLLGGLPPAFFWSAALGDIMVGLWAISIVLRRSDVSKREVAAWNIIGLLDLLHVLVLGALNLGAFYLSSPAIPPLNLLPLVGVPLLLTLHIMTLIGMYQLRKAP